ncbi:MAG: pyridoxamine 5'-phosphate oxidase family protein, partial [Alphaproteobacteria bacterium]|nr:pyridoxamine 5'-phosphate oxidase family protein [Alphaproteobacteria bacterium]
MADVPTKEELKQLVEQSAYAILSARDSDGQEYAFPVYIQSGHCLSFYWFSTMESQHSQNILNGQNQISGLIMDTNQPQGEGFALSFNGVATCFENPERIASEPPFPEEYREAEKMIKTLCDRSQTLRGKEDILMSPDSPRKLF